MGMSHTSRTSTLLTGMFSKETILVGGGQGGALGVRGSGKSMYPAGKGACMNTCPVESYDREMATQGGHSSTG